MIMLHTADGWLQPGLKDGIGWHVIRTLGGQAAPLFLLLAGMGIGLAWAAGDAQQAQARARARRMLWSRALEVVLAGYALRLVMWWIDSGTIVRMTGLVGGGLLASSYYVLWQALPHKRAQPSEPRHRLAFALLMSTAGFAYALLYLAPREPKALF